jgi:transcriptional regulator with XRE-family HTH domain
MTKRVTAPGDLGRRVRRRREALGMSRELLAQRAGVDPGYVGYLEENPVSIPADTVYRLATALQTTSDELLGGSADRPPGHGHAAARPRLEKLDPDECMRLIAPGGVGRVGFNDATGPVVVPVNYVIHEGSVLFRTAIGGPLDADLRTGIEGAEFVIAFEVDRIDDPNREGWSVLIRGAFHHISAAEESSVAAAGVEPWAGGDRRLYVRTTPSEITGRRISRV